MKKQKTIKDVLCKLLWRFKKNSEIEKSIARLMRERCKAIAAHDATIRSELWFCAANSISDEIAANKKRKK